MNTIDLYYNMGLMPEQAYMQLNGKSAQENYITLKRKYLKQFELNKNQE